MEAIASAPWPRLSDLNLSKDPRLFRDRNLCRAFAAVPLPALCRLDLDWSGITYDEGGPFWCLLVGSQWLGSAAGVCEP